MHSTERRSFLLKVVAGTCALAVSRLVVAEEKKAKGKLTEDDAYARSMGFKLDTTQVDQKRYPKHTVEQSCSSCQLFKGNPGDAEGPCSFFGQRIVPANGWCRNYKVKKA
jgi:hypothetical protein